MNAHSPYLLLVESNDGEAEMTIRELRKFHLANDLVHLKDGDQALDFLFPKLAGGKELRSLPLIILLDIQIPGANCLKVLRKIKEDKRTHPIPVILLTTSGLHSDMHACYESGASSYIVKPLNFERFAQAVRGLGLFWILLSHAPQRVPLLKGRNGL